MKNEKKLQSKGPKETEQELFDEWDREMEELISDPVDADYWFLG